MNYLDLVNNVLRRMREDTVNSLYQNAQSSVVSDFINDAKRHVEDSHNWNAFRQDISVPTVAGVSEYSLTGTQNRATISDVRDTTSSAWLTRQTAAWMRKNDLVDQGQSRVSYYSIYGIDSAGDNILKVYPTPDAIYKLKAHGSVRPIDLAAEGSLLTIPHMPVIHYALALAQQERGGVDGQELSSAFAFAKRSLGDAIQYDAANVSDEMVWYPI